MQWFCPSCGASVSGEASADPAVCPRCGRPAEPLPEAVQSTASTTGPTQLAGGSPPTQFLGPPGARRGRRCARGQSRPASAATASSASWARAAFGVVYLRPRRRAAAARSPSRCRTRSGVAARRDAERLPGRGPHRRRPRPPAHRARPRRRAARRTAPASSSRGTSRGTTSGPGLRATRLSTPPEAAELVARWPRPCTTPTARGLVHRDIKPANILLDAGRRAVRRRLRPGPAGGGHRPRARGTPARRRT